MNTQEALLFIQSRPDLVERIEINVFIKSDQNAAVAKPKKQNALEKEYLRLLDQIGPTPDGEIPFSMYTRLSRTPAGTNVLIFGSALSAIVTGRRGANVTAVEHLRERMDHLVSHLSGDVMLIQSEVDDSGWYSWKPDYGTLFDIIILDGPLLRDACGTEGRRTALIERIGSLLAAGGSIFVDDTDQTDIGLFAEALTAKLGLKPYGFGDSAGGSPRKYHLLTPPKVSKNSGPGTELQKIFKKHGYPFCRPCEQLAYRMNDWGVSGCEEHFAEIVEDILPRAKKWLREKQPYAMSMFRFVAGEKYTDEAIRKLIAIPVTEAIHACKP